MSILLSMMMDQKKDIYDGLTFAAEQANSTVAWRTTQNANINPDIKYSYDGETWNSLAKATTITLANVGDKVYIKGNNSSGLSQADENSMIFSLTGKVAASGNVNSLLDDGDGSTITTIPNNNCFINLFYGCDALTTPPRLPATTLKNACYCYMFMGCTSLRTLPVLPAMTMAEEDTYAYMFCNCTSITSIPSNYLPATTLGQWCYQAMFRGCTGLTSVPSGLLSATTSLEISCYQQMFQDCTELVSVPVDLLPATTLKYKCYISMFNGCTKLTNVPNLPATTLAGLCYNQMFAKCQSLTTVPTNLLPVTTMQTECYKWMFSGCSSLTNVPVLPATTLATDCYYGIFQNCNKINNIKINYTGNFSNSYFTNWVLNVSSTGDFYYNGSDTSRGVNAIPNNWTIHTF